MGIYYTAKTIIGYKITDINRFDEHVVPSCAHNPPQDAQYCPTCGRKVGTHTKRTMRDDWKRFDDLLHESRLPHGLVYEEDPQYAGDIWIGYGGDSIERGESGMITIRPFDEIKAATIEFLEPFVQIGLFTLDENNFGIWTLNIGH